MKMLFVGGLVDGEWREVEALLPVIQVLFRDKGARVDLSSWMARSAPTGQTEIYKLLTMEFEDDQQKRSRLQLYAHPSLTHCEVYLKLMVHYSPTKK